MSLLQEFFEEHSPENLELLIESYMQKTDFLMRHRVHEYLTRKLKEVGLTYIVLPKDTVGEYDSPLVSTCYDLPYHLVSFSTPSKGSPVSVSGHVSTPEFNWENFGYGARLCEAYSIEDPCINGLHELFVLLDETYSTAHPKVLKLQSLDLAPIGPFPTKQVERETLEAEGRLLELDNISIDLKAYWRTHSVQKLADQIRIYNIMGDRLPPNHLACPCKVCTERDGELFTNWDGYSMPVSCRLQKYLEYTMDRIGITYTVIYKDELEFDRVADDGVGPDFLGRCKFSPYLPPVFPQDYHIVFVENMNWSVFGYGEQLWGATSTDSPELDKLSRLFAAITNQT